MFFLTLWNTYKPQLSQNWKKPKLETFSSERISVIFRDTFQAQFLPVSLSTTESQKEETNNPLVEFDPILHKSMPKTKTQQTLWNKRKAM